MLRQFKISTAILLMAIGATIALVLLPQYPHWLNSRVETAQSWVDDIWPRSLDTSDELATWSVTRISPSQEIKNEATGDPIYGISADATNNLSFSIDLYPKDVIPDFPYVLTLFSNDGFKLANTHVIWTEWELSHPGIRSRDLNKVRASELAKTKKVVLEITGNDISIPAFIDEYNQEAREIARRYDKNYFEYCEVSMKVGFSVGIEYELGNPECLGDEYTPPLFEYPEEKSNAIISKHYKIELNAPDRYQGKPVIRTD